MICIEDQPFSRSYDVAPPRSTHMKTEKDRHLAEVRWGEDGGEAKSYDGEKAWSSVNHSVYSLCHTIIENYNAENAQGE